MMQALMTLTATTSLLMSSKHQRWLRLREMLVVQGLPIDTRYTHGTPCSSYALRCFLENDGLPHCPWPSRRAACEQSGNSMHTSASGLCFLYMLTQVMMCPQMMYAQFVNMCSRARLEGWPVHKSLLFHNTTLRDRSVKHTGASEVEESPDSPVAILAKRRRVQ